MPTVDVRNRGGEVVGRLELAPDVFDVPWSGSLVHQVIVGQQANRRQGTSNTRGRSDVRGGGIKPYRQKGTGRARQGSIRAAQFRGGGTVFGPHPRSWRVRLPRRMRRAAVRQILSDKVRHQRLIVLEELELDRPRTRDVAGLLATLGLDRRVLLVVEPEAPNVLRSAANLPQVTVERAERVSALAAMRAHTIVATRAAAQRLEEMYRP